MDSEVINTALPQAAGFDARHAVLAFLVTLALESDQHQPVKLALPALFRKTLRGFPEALAVVESVRTGCAESIAATVQEVLKLAQDASGAAEESKELHAHVVIEWAPAIPV